MPRALAFAVLAALALATPAAAAPPWSAPEDLSRAHTFVDSPTVGVSGDGTTLATWRWGDGVGTSGTAGLDRADRPPRAAAFTPAATLSAARRTPTVVTPPVLYGRSRALVATTRPASSDPADARARVAAVFGRADGTFGTPRSIAVRTGLRGVQLAGAADGAAAIAWWEDRGTTNDRVYVSLRKPGGSFGTPILLAQQRIRSVSVAVSPRGDVLVAWDARGVIRARVTFNFSRAFHAADTIRSQDAFFATLHTAMTGNGRAFVAWGAQFLSEGGSTGPVFYQVAVRPSGASRFRPAQLLEQEPATRTQAGLALVVDAANRATVAWTGFDARNARVRVADTGGGVTFGAPQEVSPAGADAFAGALAGTVGKRLVAYTTGDLVSGGQLFAAVQDGLAPYGSPELISPGAEARQPAAAYDGRASRWTLVWSDRPAGSGGPRPPPVDQVKTYAQAASRTAG